MTIAKDTSANQIAAYSYDANGQRVKRTVAGQPEVWQVYGIGGELRAEYAANTGAATPQKEYGYRNGQLLITAEAPARTNVALAANGGTASGSSSLNANFPAAVNNGGRKGLNWGSGGGWADSTSGTFPDWLQLEFNGSKSIDEVDVFTLQNNYASPAEPTEAMRFSSYGLSGYEVQYWNGTAWVTVSGGSVTSNNKVWRKITFAAVTTNKIRVLTNSAIDNGYSRITEVEAWESATAIANLNWLVTDQLGTPRMVFEQSGSLATVKRHDYAPFGEELANGVRPTTGGYSSGDAIRQKFTQKERDSETGLDFFKARYYSPTQGRFTSADPIVITSYRLVNPQALNGYSYVANTPLKFTDPTGKKIEFKTKEDAEIALALYQGGLDKDQQKYVSTEESKSGTFSLRVDEKAGKSAAKDSLLGRLYLTASADPVAVVSFVKKGDSISVTIFTEDGKKGTVLSSLSRIEAAGLTLLPAESRRDAVPQRMVAHVYSAVPNKTQLVIATDPAAMTPTQAIFAETLVHFGEFVRTGNPASASHRSPGLTEMEERVVEEAGRNEKANTPPKKPD